MGTAAKTKVAENKNAYEPTRTGLGRDTIARAVIDNLCYTVGRVTETATPHDSYAALAYTVRDRLFDRFIRTVHTLMRSDTRVVSYLSAEFLIGPHLGNALVNLGVYDEAQEALKSLGLDLEARSTRRRSRGSETGA